MPNASPKLFVYDPTLRSQTGETDGRDEVTGTKHVVGWRTGSIASSGGGLGSSVAEAVKAFCQTLSVRSPSSPRGHLKLRFMKTLQQGEHWPVLIIKQPP